MGSLTRSFCVQSTAAAAEALAQAAKLGQVAGRVGMVVGELAKTGQS